LNNHYKILYKVEAPPKACKTNTQNKVPFIGITSTFHILYNNGNYIIF